MKSTNGKTRFAICLDNQEYEASLERGKIYQVLADAKAARHGLTRVIDESGEDYLYPTEWFHSLRLPKSVQQVLAHAGA